MPSGKKLISFFFYELSIRSVYYFRNKVIKNLLPRFNVRGLKFVFSSTVVFLGWDGNNQPNVDKSIY